MGGILRSGSRITHSGTRHPKNPSQFNYSHLQLTNRPFVAYSDVFRKQATKSIQEILPVFVAQEYDATFDPLDHQMVQSTGSI
jgi:hypothetical protein